MYFKNSNNCDCIYGDTGAIETIIILKLKKIMFVKKKEKKKKIASYFCKTSRPYELV